MRRRRPFYAILILLSLLISSCGTKTGYHRSVSWKPVYTLRLAVRDGIYADVIEKSLADFEEKTHIYCEVVRLDEEELHSSVIDNLKYSVGNYDLCMVDGSWMAEYTSLGALLNLSEYGYVLDDDIIAATKKICYCDGDVYLAPFYGNVTILLYNKRLAAAAGYPGGNIPSLTELLDICEYARKHRNYGFMYRGDTPNNIVVDFLPFLLSFGGWVVDGNNAPTIDTPEFRAAMEYYLKLIGTGKADSKDNLILAIVNQAAAMGVGWPGWYTPERNGQADYAALTGAVTKDSVRYNANVYGIWAIGIPKNCPNRTQALKVLKYLMDPEVQLASVRYGGVPCRYSSLKNPEILKEFPQYKPVRMALENGVYRPIMAEWKEFYTILGYEMDLIIKGEKTVEEGLRSAQSRLETELYR